MRSVRDKDSRPRKSWRDIDAMKNKSHHTGEDREENTKDVLREHSSAYQTYKRDLEKLFDGSEVPEYLAEQLPEEIVVKTEVKTDAKPEANPGQLKKLGAIRRASDSAQLAEAVKSYLDKHEDFPEDFDILAKVLEVEDDTARLKAARLLDQMERVLPVPRKTQFILKLDSIAMLTDDDDLRELATDLVKRLRR